MSSPQQPEQLSAIPSSDPPHKRARLSYGGLSPLELSSSSSRSRHLSDETSSSSSSSLHVEVDSRHAKWKDSLDTALNMKLIDSSSEVLNVERVSEEIVNVLHQQLSIPLSNIHMLTFPSLRALNRSKEAFTSSVEQWKCPLEFLTRQKAVDLLPYRSHVLMGRLVANNDDVMNRLVVVDRTGSIPVHCIHPNANLVGRWALFYRWSLLIAQDNLVKSSLAERVLEIDANHVVILDSAAHLLELATPALFLPVPVPTIATSLFSNEINKRIKLTHESCSISNAVGNNSTSSGLHFEGELVTKSPLITVGSRAFLCLELLVDVNRAVWILLTHEQARTYQHFLIVGRFYLFANLEAKKLHLPNHSQVARLFGGCKWAEGTAVGVELGFYEISRKCLMIFDITALKPTFTFAQSKEQETDCGNSTFATGSLASASASKYFIHAATRSRIYDGIIAGYIAPGVYELECDPSIRQLDQFNENPLRRPSQLHLYLTHSQSACNEDGVGLRKGTRVQLYNAHTLCRNKRFFGIALCAAGHVQIINFSPRRKCFPPWTWRSLSSTTPSHAISLAYWRWYRQTSVHDTALLIDLVAQLKAKLQLTQREVQAIALDLEPASCGAIHTLVADQCRFDHKSDERETFFYHAQCCSVKTVSTDYQEEFAPSLPSFNDMLLLPMIKRVCRELQETNDGDAVVRHVEVHSDAIRQNCGARVIGYLYRSQSSLSNTSDKLYLDIVHLICPCSEWYLRDSLHPQSSKIACVIIGSTETLKTNGLYWVSCYRLVFEKWSHATTSAITGIKKHVQISFCMLIEATSLVLLHSNEQGNVANNHLAPNSRPSWYYTHSTNCVSIQALSPANHAGTPQLLDFPQLSTLDCSHILSDTDENHRFRIRGLVLSKEWRQDMAIIIRHSPPTFRWCLKLCDPQNSLRVMEVYVELKPNNWPCALLPGYIVELDQCIRKLSRQKWRISFFCPGAHCVRVLAVPGRTVETTNADIDQDRNLRIPGFISPEDITLSSFYHQQPIVRQCPFMVRCRVIALKKFKLSLECSNSEHKRKDYRLCTYPYEHCHHLEKISLICLITDGTCCAYVNAYQDWAWSLLDINENQRKQLHEFVRLHGSFQSNALPANLSSLNNVVSHGLDLDVEKQHRELLVLLHQAVTARQLMLTLQQFWSQRDVTGYIKRMEDITWPGAPEELPEFKWDVGLSSVSQIKQKIVKIGYELVNTMGYASDPQFEVRGVHATPVNTVKCAEDLLNSLQFN